MFMFGRCGASSSASAASARLLPALPGRRLLSSSSPSAASYVAAIDQGTSSTRVILYDADSLAPVASHQVPLSITTPHPGWAQMDPSAILASVEACAQGALAAAGASPGQVAGVGITNQRETTVVWDRRTGEPLYDAILWLDARTRDTVAKLEPEMGGQDALRGTCGLPLSTYFSGVKLRWLLDNVPEVKAAVGSGDALVGTVDAWLTWKLSGGKRHVTDITNASRTMLMDLNTASWDASCVAALGLDPAIMGALPEIASCAEPLAEVDAAACPSLAGVSITGCVGDQQAAMVGQRCFSPGMAKTTCVGALVGELGRAAVSLCVRC